MDPEFLERLSGERVFGYILIIGGLIIPGMSYIYFSNPSQFNNLEIIRLFILAIFYSFPLILFSNIVIQIILWKDVNRPKDRNFILLAVSGLLAMGSCYGGLILSLGLFKRIDLILHFMYLFLILITISIKPLFNLFDKILE